MPAEILPKSSPKFGRRYGKGNPTGDSG